MFDKRKALDYILDIAYNRGITQSKLIGDIYDYSHFNRMCNGKEEINMEVLFACADKLNISYNTLFNNSNNEDEIRKNNLKAEFEKLTQLHDHKGILKLQKNLKLIETDDNEFNQLKRIVDALILWRFDKNYDVAIITLKDALGLNMKLSKIESIACDKLSETEISIINDIAICYF